MSHIVLYLLSVFSLAQAAGLVRLAEAPPDIIGTWRLTGAAMLLLPIAWHRGHLSYRNIPHSVRWTIIASGVFFYLHLWTYFYAVHNTSIARCMILFSTNPVFTSLGSLLFLGDRFYRRFLIAFPLAFVGILILIKGSTMSQGLSFTDLGSGDVMALISALLYAAYIVTGTQARRVVSNLSYALSIYSLAAVFFASIAALRGLSFTGYSSATWLAILGTILVPTLLGHFLFSYLLRFLNPSLMTCGKLLEPVIASLMAFWLFGELVSLSTLIAFACTSAAVIILFWPRQSNSFLRPPTSSVRL